MKFTDISVNSLPVPARNFKCFWEHPLGVRVTAKGVRSYIVIAGSGDRKTLGRVGVLSLREARVEALRVKSETHPAKYRAPPIRMSEARQRYLEAIEVRPATHRCYTTYLADLPDLLLDQIDHRHILHILDNAPRGSRKLRLRTFSAFFSWCIPRFIKNSPCTGLRVPALQSRSRVLSDEELGRIWRACDQRTVTPRTDASLASSVSNHLAVHCPLPTSFCRIVQLLMVSGMRRTECSLIEKSWLNEKDKTLTIPAIVTKNARELKIPLSVLSAALLIQAKNTQPRASGYIFSATTDTSSAFSSWSNAKTALDEASGVTGYRLHDIRHTYRSNLARLRCPPHIAERLVNHVSSRSVLEKIYDHYTYADEMREWQGKYEEWFANLLMLHHVQLTIPHDPP
jgi:integrase